MLAARFGLDAFDHALTLVEIGGTLGISEERVRQVTLRASEKLREAALELRGQPLLGAV